MTARRPPGGGSIYRRAADGRWFGVLELDATDGRRQRKTVSASSRTEVEGKLAQLRSDLQAAGILQSLTVGRFLEDWLTNFLPGTVGSPNTIDNHTWAINTHLVPALGDKWLVRLSPADVAELLRTKTEAGMAIRSAARLRICLGAALSQAVAEGLVVRNVAKLVRSPRGPIRYGRALTVEQAQGLLAAARGDRLEAAFVLMLMLGLRPGETLALRWQDIDFDARTLVVTHSLKRERDGLRLGATKTPQSRRALAMPAAVVHSLRGQRRRQARQRIAAGPTWCDLDLVFTTRAGTPVEPARLRKRLASVTERAGLGRWHPHELRHSAVSLLSAAGLRLEDVADVMGHRSTRTTSAVYRHVVIPVIDAGVAPMERLFPSPA